MGENPTADGVAVPETDAVPDGVPDGVPTRGPVPRPASLRLAAALVGVLVLLGAVLTVLAAVLDDEILRATGGAGVSADDTRVPASFAPVVVVLDVVATGLVLTLAALLLAGHDWARHSLTATLALIAVATVSGLTTAGVPPTVVVAGVVVLVVEAALVALLYRPEVGAWVRRPPEA